MMQEELVDTDNVEMDDDGSNASTRDPAILINTYFCTVLDVETGESYTARTHNYGLYECALDVKYKLKAGFELVEVYQPDSNQKLSHNEIKELK